MAYYDVETDYNGGDKPETEIVNTSYDGDAPRRFLCDGTGGTSCDFGYADWPADSGGTAMPMITETSELEQVTHSQAWSKNTSSWNRLQSPGGSSRRTSENTEDRKISQPWRFLRTNIQEPRRQIEFTALGFPSNEHPRTPKIKRAKGLEGFFRRTPTNPEEFEALEVPLGEHARTPKIEKVQSPGCSSIRTPKNTEDRKRTVGI